MQLALKFQFERAVGEYARWRAVPEGQRSDASGWWWGTAIAAVDEKATMPLEWCATLGVADESTYAEGAEVFIKALADQTHFPWPDGFPGKSRATEGAYTNKSTKPAPFGDAAPASAPAALWPTRNGRVEAGEPWRRSTPHRRVRDTRAGWHYHDNLVRCQAHSLRGGCIADSCCPASHPCGQARQTHHWASLEEAKGISEVAFRGPSGLVLTKVKTN
jgi:hypothetical protein